MLRAWRIGLRASAGLLVVCAVVAGAIAWRLAQGPIRLDFLTPRIESALAPSDGSLRVVVGATQLEWIRESRDVELRLHDVVVHATAGGVVGTLPVAVVRLSAWRLLCGTVAPRSIEVRGARLHLVRMTDGRIVLGDGAAPPETGAAPTSLELDEHLLPPALRLVEIDDATAMLTDVASGTVSRIEHVALTLARGAGAVILQLAGTLVAGDLHVPVWVEGAHRWDATGTSLTISARDLAPDALATRLPEIGSLLAGIRLLVGGSVHLVLDGALRPLSARIEITGGPGTVVLEKTSLAVAGIDGTASVDLATGVIDVERLRVGLSPATLEIAGHLSATGSRGAVDLEATVTGLPTDGLGKQWPSSLAPDARRWITTNLSGGQVRRAHARLTGTLADGQPDSFVLDGIDGTFVFDGLTVRYRDAMPPAKGVAGEGTFSSQAWSVKVARGSLDALEIVRATVAVSSPARGAPRIDVDGAVRGPLVAGLAVLASDPALDVGAGLGVRPRDMSGRLTARLGLRIPLQGRSKLVDLAPRVSAELRGVAVSHLPRDWSLSAGDLDLKLTGRSLELDGTARLGTTPVSISWREDVGTPASRRVDVRGRIDTVGRAALGFDTTPWIDGPIDARVRLVPERGAQKLDLHLDLRRAVLTMPVLDLAKPAGSPGHVDALLAIDGNAIAAIDRLELLSGDSSIEGRATFSQSGVWRTIDAKAMVAAPRPGEQAGRFALVVRPAGGASHFTLTSDDAGVLFRALDAYADAEGGRLTFAGRTWFDAPDLPFEGHVEMRRFTLTRSPMIARLVQMSSLSGIADTLKNRGLKITELTTSISHRNRIVTMTDGLLAGPSLGIQWNGTLDRSRGTLSLKGTLSPAYYGLNRVAAQIPVLGQMLTGVNKEGFHAIDFAVRGPMRDPQVSVQPLSMLAPGVLRDLMRRVVPR